jgi:phosphatidate cytidylyltransferase
MAQIPRRPRPAAARPGPPPPTANEHGSELAERILVGLPALIVTIALVALGGIPFALALALLGSFCLHELFSLYKAAQPARLAGFLGLIALIAAGQFADTQTVLLIAVAAIPATFILAVLAGRGTGSFGLALTLLGIWWIGLALAHAVLLRRLPHGGGIVIDVLAGTFVGDSAAYLGGRAFGRNLLAPAISPKKTVEGLLFGIVFAVGAVWFASLYQPWLHKGDALLLGLGVAIAAPLGDLFESFIKRDAGTKDSGRLFGAHGGALDRLDAVLFAAVAGYYIWHAMVLH